MSLPQQGNKMVLKSGQIIFKWYFLLKIQQMIFYLLIPIHSPKINNKGPKIASFGAVFGHSVWQHRVWADDDLSLAPRALFLTLGLTRKHETDILPSSQKPQFVKKLCIWIKYTVHHHLLSILLVSRYGHRALNVGKFGEIKQIWAVAWWMITVTDYSKMLNSQFLE